MPEPKKGLYYYNVADENADDERVRHQKNNRMLIKTIISLLLIISALAVALNSGDIILSELGLCHPPAGAAFENLDTDIDTSHDPLQASYKGEAIKRVVSKDEYTIVPLATYEISAMLESKRFYSASDVDPEDRLYSKLVPVDLCVVWGKLVELAIDTKIRYNQGKRNCEWRTDVELPVDYKYVKSHFSNNHIIPANENIHNAIRGINLKEKVVLPGYLVNVFLKKDEKESLFLQTSLKRTDGDDGKGCEVFYVKSVRIGNKIYE